MESRTLVTLTLMTITININATNASWFGGSESDPLHVLSKPSIEPWGSIKQNRAVVLRTLKGYQDCQGNDGRGPVVDVRLESCSQTPCRVFPDQSLAMEVDFRPRDAHGNLTLRSVIQGWSPARQTVWQEIEEELVPESAVSHDELYTLTVPFTVPSVMGGFAHFRIELLEDAVRELCLNIHINIDLRDEL